jgi:hypothetical protein
MMRDQPEKEAETCIEEDEVEDEADKHPTRLWLNVSNAINWDTFNMSVLIGKKGLITLSWMKKKNSF